MDPIRATKALYIKLGQSGLWEASCIKGGTLRLGYSEYSHEDCEARNWPSIGLVAKERSGSVGAATSHVNQIKNFYEEPEETLWVTFFSDRLWWCHAKTGVELDSSRDSRVRCTVSGWCDRDIQGKPLHKAGISGKLLAVQGFQGTICKVGDISYLLHKLNGTVQPHVAEAQAAFEVLVAKITPLIKQLHQKDFEILVDLIFRQGGWARVGVAGGVERDIDLDLMSPITGERIAVQVKSRAGRPEYERYRDIYADMSGFSRFYFVTHSPHRDLKPADMRPSDPSFVCWGAEDLARLAAKNGLVGWLLDKAS